MKVGSPKALVGMIAAERRFCAAYWSNADSGRLKQLLEQMIAARPASMPKRPKSVADILAQANAHASGLA